MQALNDLQNKIKIPINECEVEYQLLITLYNLKIKDSPKIRSIINLTSMSYKKWQIKFTINIVH